MNQNLVRRSEVRENALADEIKASKTFKNRKTRPPMLEQSLNTTGGLLAPAEQYEDRPEETKSEQIRQRVEAE